MVQVDTGPYRYGRRQRSSTVRPRGTKEVQKRVYSGLVGLTLTLCVGRTEVGVDRRKRVSRLWSVYGPVGESLRQERGNLGYKSFPS